MEAFDVLRVSGSLAGSSLNKHPDSSAAASIGPSLISKTTEQAFLEALVLIQIVETWHAWRRQWVHSKKVAQVWQVHIQAIGAWQFLQAAKFLSVPLYSLFLRVLQWHR